jgi:ubiquinone/menaquinone biosynthesis C-methylase UbiE
MKSDHFDDLSSRYDQFRTLDYEPVRYLASKLPECEHTICDLGCGTGRYLMALIEHLQAKRGVVKRAYGVDTSPGMLEEAMKYAEKFEIPISWVEATSHKTDLASASISLVTAFNAIHHFSIKETLDEVQRLARPKALLAVYTRLREQEPEHVWGRWFPGYLNYSVNPTRDFILSFSQLNDTFAFVDSRDFTFLRKTTFAWICAQTRNRYYSTLARYPDAEFERAFQTFVANLTSNFEDLNEIRYPSTYSMFLFEVKPSPYQ